VKLVALLASPAALLAGVCAIPVLLANGDPPAALACAPNAASIDAVLATIRHIESGGNYQAANQGSSASGGYQIIDSTWNHYGGYQQAADAPPDTQDAKATEMVTAILTQHGDVAAVPVVWYIGHLPGLSDPEWDTVPAPEAGNRLTPRQYQRRWMSYYNDLIGATEPVGNPGAPTTASPNSIIAGPVGCVARAPGETLPDGWALPGPQSLLDATVDQLDDPHHDYPAWDWVIPAGTPIYAVRAGTVAATYAWPHNWWEQGCTTAGVNGCTTCGIGVTIVDNLGTRWTYCHGSDLHVTLGSNVGAGTLIIDSGNTGRSGTPHLHFEIRTNGTQRCPQPLITSLYRTGKGVDPLTLPTTGCSF
jgi:hypothetical protein